MKRVFGIFMTACVALVLAACGAKQAEPEPEAKEWTRQGTFVDESENMLSIVWDEDVDEPGWLVGVMGEDISGGCVLAQEGNTLHGDLNGWDDGADPLIVTVSEEGADGVLLEVEGGKSYHFKPYEMPEASIVVTINTEGMGNIGYAEGEVAPEEDPEYPSQSAYIGLAEPATHTFAAWPEAGNVFVKWTKDGEDFSTDAQVTLLLDESADYVAVFEEDPDGQNPVMNFVGTYQSDRAKASVEATGYDEATISIEWPNSASEMTNWVISGQFDQDSRSVSYEGCTKRNFVYDESGEVVSDDGEYEEVPGAITFNDDGTLTWHRDLPEGGEDLVFEWVGA